MQSALGTPYRVRIYDRIERFVLSLSECLGEAARMPFSVTAYSNPFISKHRL